MASSPLDPASGPRTPDRDVRRGHGTRALGPSDSSDSGSDADASVPDSDTDRYGTGERSDAEMDDAGEGEDIAPDHLERIPDRDDEKS